jgi:hypothetical protein
LRQKSVNRQQLSASSEAILKATAKTWLILKAQRADRGAIPHYEIFSLEAYPEELRRE